MKILVVDDDQSMLDLIQAILSPRENIEVVVSTGGAVSSVKEHQPDLVLLDICLEDENGLDSLKEIRDLYQDLPVILVSAEQDVERVVKGLNMGANDYIRKPFQSQELLARVGAHLRVQTLQEHLKRLLDLDHVTDLFNMRSMYVKVAEKLREQKVHKSLCAVVMLDLDNFKLVNDKNDHLFGTQVLSEVGALLKIHLSPEDLGARYGGDEFMLFLVRESEEELRLSLSQLREDLNSQSFLYEPENRKVKVTCSMGLAWTPSHKEVPPKSLVALADAALYKAKHSGRDCFVIKELVLSD